MVLSTSDCCKKGGTKLYKGVFTCIQKYRKRNIRVLAPSVILHGHGTLYATINDMNTPLSNFGKGVCRKQFVQSMDKGNHPFDKSFRILFSNQIRDEHPFSQIFSPTPLSWSGVLVHFLAIADHPFSNFFSANTFLVTVERVLHPF